MKKIIILSLTLAILGSITACGQADESSSAEVSENQSVTEETTEADGSQESPAKSLYSKFKNIMSDGQTHTTTEIAEAMISAENIPFKGSAEEMQPGWFNGFNTEITGFKSAAFFGPMISSIPFVGYIFELEDSSNITAFVDNLNEQANPAWNICTQADEKICEAEGNMVFFVMAPASFEEE